MPFFGVPIRNGLPIGLGSVAGFGVQQFDPSQLFAGGTVAGAWYDPSDLSTLFTTSAGTTPVAMPGQGAAVSVGLMLDKSQGLVLGSELITPAANRDFSSDTGYWTKGAGVTISGGSANFSAASNYVLYRGSGLPAGNPGAYYEVTFTVTNYVSGSIRPYLGVSPTLGTAVSANGTYIQRFCPTSGGEFGFNAPVAFTGSIDNVSIKQVLGNHAIAFNNTTARPELRARVNLLTYSEEFDNGVWTNLNAATNIVANATTAPNGTNTADFFRVAATTNTDHLIRATNTVSVAASTYILTWRIKANGITRFRMAVASETSLVNRAWVNVNLSTRAQTGGNDGAGFTFVSSDVTLEDAYGFQTVSLTYTTTVGTVIPYIVMQDASGNFTFAGTVDTGLYIWGADLRPANIGANVPAYQRIADANTYDTSGFPLYLLFDGIDDSMYTPANLNLSGTDKVAVFAGVRKFNNTTQQFIVETSTNVSTNNGAFALLTNTNNGGGSLTAAYGGAFRGTSSAGFGAAGTTAPISNVVTAIGNIAAVTDASILRVNGAQVATSGATSAGTGNFGTYPMYIASRQGIAPNLLEGHLHSLIVVGSAVSAGNISATEQWVAGKTGLVLP